MLLNKEIYFRSVTFEDSSKVTRILSDEFLYEVRAKNIKVRYDDDSFIINYKSTYEVTITGKDGGVSFNIEYMNKKKEIIAQKSISIKDGETRVNFYFYFKDDNYMFTNKKEFVEELAPDFKYE
ncbi:hypothetical protein FRY74_06330 [Vicingus serpentipes]|uniref:Uncharacterized protein n=1 Tax=Vicingus serpentipes TaxID=1926625 RepID=A0A5C6RUK9_9FLAO|nr:hypothetical protein [Vicingus serpentipes]TXB66186.1 hypothetical protein FRY74_06330 [Vicingus serpentipes]